ncbi:MAG: hypothetical protein RLZZ519_411 [Bacteroidota bacterium]
MRKTLNVLYWTAIAVVVPIVAFGQQPIQQVDRGSKISNSFRSNAIRKPDSMARVGAAWPGIDADCGLHRNAITGRLYTSFMDGYVQNDLDVARAIGSMSLNSDNNEYRFGPKKEVGNTDRRGTECSFNFYDSTTTIKGRFDFRPNFQPKTAEMEFAGVWKDVNPKPWVTAELMGRFELACIPGKAWEKLVDKALITTALNHSVDWENETLLAGLSEFLDPDPEKSPKNMQAFRKELDEDSSLYHRIQGHAKIPASLLLSGLQFNYDEELNSLWYYGEVGLLAINGISINKLTSNNSKLEYVMVPHGPNQRYVSDTLRIYLEFDDLNWVFFEFYDDVVRTISSDVDGYNAILESSRHKKSGFRFKMIGEERRSDGWFPSFTGISGVPVAKFPNDRLAIPCEIFGSIFLIKVCVLAVFSRRIDSAFLRRFAPNSRKTFRTWKSG